MRTFSQSIALIAVTAILASCSDSQSTAPLATDTLSEASRSDHVASAIQSHDARTVRLFDQCDSATFNAALGVGTCVGHRGGDVTFQEFIDHLERHHVAPGWRFSPAKLEVKLGDSFIAQNLGGEVHTFTEVEEFGGGIVPTLNVLTGLTEPAPECQALTPADFIAAGGSHSDTPDEVGTEKYQCCIHPWMRATVRTFESKGGSHSSGDSHKP